MWEKDLCQNQPSGKRNSGAFICMAGPGFYLPALLPCMLFREVIQLFSVGVVVHSALASTARLKLAGNRIAPPGVLWIKFDLYANGRERGCTDDFTGGKDMVVRIGSVVTPVRVVHLNT